MDVGVLIIFQNYQDQMSDAEAYARDLRITDLAEPLGFQSIWCVEHHFNNYSMGPDNMQFLSWVAGRTKTIKLGTGAVILPWNDPLRVVEKMVLLDHLSGGRALFGVGRGLARREYGAFMIDMNEARERFDESAEMIVDGLENGFVEGEGPFYEQVRTEVRPRPLGTFKDRFYMVAMSPDSVPVCARLGGAMMTFAQKPWEQMADHFNTYRRLFREHQGRDAKPVVCVDFMACDESAERAEALARKHMSAYYLTVVQHYEMMSDHFESAKGYAAYAEASQVLRDAGLEAIGNAFVDINTWGTPTQILEKLEERRRLIGDFDLTIQPSYGGMAEDDARAGMELFAKKVLPELKSWGPAPKPQAAAE